VTLKSEGSPLVAGSSGGQAGAVSVQVVRAFLVAGERVEPGSIVSLPRSVAAQVIHSGQAIPAPDVAPVVEETPPAEPPASKKVKSNARK